MSTATPESVLENLHIKDYVLENVYLCTTEAQRSEILAFWRNEGAGLEGADAERSSHEAVFLIRTHSGELAGVSNVALVRLKDGRRFYSMSLFLRKQDQAIPFLGITVSDGTRDFLRKIQTSGGAACWSVECERKSEADEARCTQDFPAARL